METKAIVPIGGNVEGNITSCKIENQLLRTDKNSALSFTEVNTYASYDVCSKQVVERYIVPELTNFSYTLIIGLVIILGIILLAIASDY